MLDGEHLVDIAPYPMLCKALEILWSAAGLTDTSPPKPFLVYDEDEGGPCNPIKAEAILNKLTEEEFEELCSGDVDECIPVLIEKYGEDILEASRLLNQIFEIACNTPID